MTCLTCYVIDRSGPNQWRDSQTPRQILEYWCELNSLGKPQFLGNTQLVLDGTAAIDDSVAQLGDHVPL